MASKEISSVVKFSAQAGSATPGPPIGPALGSKGIKAMEFCKQFNDQTKEQKGSLVSVEVTIYTDRTFSFIVKSPPAAYLILQAMNARKGSGECNRKKVGSITQAQLEEIAVKKLPDTNAFTLEGAKKIVAGTARSMGVTITE